MKLTEEEKEKVIIAVETLLSRDYKSIQSVKIEDKHISIIFADSVQKYMMKSCALDILKEKIPELLTKFPYLNEL